MVSISDTILCFAQKSNISCVSLIPPIKEPTSCLLFNTKFPGLTAGCGAFGTQTKHIVPSLFNKFKY